MILFVDQFCQFADWSRARSHLYVVHFLQLIQLGTFVFWVIRLLPTERKLVCSSYLGLNTQELRIYVISFFARSVVEDN